MFKSINIKNFRAITDLNLDNLGQVNLFVGKNNCGKTTVLEGLFFLTGAPNPNLPINVNALRGLTVFNKDLWNTYFHNMDTESTIKIMGVLSDNSEEYDLSIQPIYKDAEPPITSPSDMIVTNIENGIKEPSMFVNGLEFTYVNSREPDKKKKGKIFIRDKEIAIEGKKATSFNGILLSPLAMYDWKERFDSAQRKKQIPEIISILKEIDIKIVDVRLNAVGMLEADIGLSNLLPFNLIGNGTIKLLNVALAMFDYTDGIVLIDEIDNGLHHSVQETLWRAIFAWSNKLNIQVFATTHSYESVQAFAKCAKESLFGNQAKLYRIERKDEEFKSIEFETEELDRFIENMWEMR